jgi:ribosomal protein L13
VIVNSEKSVITGRKNTSIEKYKTLKSKGGSAQKGPNYSRIPYKMLHFFLLKIGAVNSNNMGYF